MLYTKKMSLAAILLASTSAVQLSAQDVATPPAEGADAASSEIIVTARRREESLSKVPISISVLGAEQLASRSITNENDLQAAVPGLVIRQNGSANAFNYVIRGQTIDTYSNSPPGVLPYTNEAQVVTHSATAFYDLGNIQVLKGPQGTLFGRNATGGAVLYQTAKATDEFGGYLSGRIGNFGAQHVEGAINFPISDAIKLRIAGSETGGGAFVRSLNTNQHYGNLEQRSIRGTLVIEPVSGLSNTTVVQHTSDGGTNTPGQAYRSSAYACGNGKYTDTADCFFGPSSAIFQSWLALHPNVNPLGTTAFANLQDKRGPWIAEGNVPLKHKAESTFVINTTSFDVSDDITIKNIMLYNKTHSEDQNDYDGTPYYIFSTQGTPNAEGNALTNQAGFIQRTKQFSDELQIQGTALDKSLNYTIGLYYLNQSSVIDSALFAFDYSPIAPGSSFFYKQKNTDKSFAAFAQATYKLTDRLNFTGGFRYTWEKVGDRQLPGSLWTFFTPPSNPFFPQSVKTSKPSWTVSVDYAVTPSLLVYATTRGSWRAGGFNYTLAPADLSTRDGGNIFEPETVKDVELGVKYNGRDLGVPFTFNFDVYNQWVSNIQRAANAIGFGGTPTLLTVNVPKAKITGAEADFSVRPASWLNLGGSLTYTNARFTDNRVAFNSIFSSSVFFYGPYADSPKWMGSAFAEVSNDFGSDVGTLTLRGDVFAQSRMYFSNLADTIAPGTDIDGYSLTNARLTWAQVMGKPITASFFMRNVFNKAYYPGGNATGPNLGVNVIFPGQPRMYGAEVKVTF